MPPIDLLELGRNHKERSPDLLGQDRADNIRIGRLRELRGYAAGDRLGVPADEIAADAEILQRALGLRSPELVRRNVDLAHAVRFHPEVGHVLMPIARRPGILVREC